MHFKHASAAQIQFSDFTRDITEQFLKQDKDSYRTQAETRNRWRYECEYTPEAEDHLIFQSRLYLRVLNAKDSKSTNPQFLNALTNLMADYLSAYTMRKVCTRKVAKQELKKALYDNNPYIQQMLTRQEIARKQKAKKKSEKNTAEQRMFNFKYVPYIRKTVLDFTPAQFLKKVKINDNWRTNIPWDETLANDIIVMTKLFYNQHIKLTGSYAANPEFLTCFTNMIIDYLAIYFKRAPQHQDNKQAAYDFLINELMTENEFLVRIRNYEEKMNAKRKKRKNYTAEPEQEQTISKTGRPRIKINKSTTVFNDARQHIWNNTRTQR